MDGELWKELYRAALEIGKHIPNHQVTFPHVRVVLVFLWAVLHDRPVSWACRQENWPDREDWPKPSASTMSRRLRRPQVQSLLDALLDRYHAQLGSSGYRWMDGKPLVIGNHSKDPDAGYGRAAGGKAKGYKLHAIWDASGALLAWQVHPMHVSEQRVARDLIAQLDDGGFLVADSNYDVNKLYDLAGEHRHQLLTPRRFRKARGLGHQRHSHYRLRAIRMIEDGPGKPLLRRRAAIERQFGCMGNFPGGLGPLSNWTRRLHRVRLWVHAKLIINACRIARNKRLAA